MANRTQRISDERQQEIVRLYGEGLSRLRVAADVGVSIETVNNILTRHGVAFRPAWSRSFTPQMELALIERYQQGESLNALADEYGVAFETVRKVFNRHGVQRRDDRGHRRDYTEDEVERIRQMATEGKSQDQIARALGSAQTTISKLMKRHGMTPAATGYSRRERHYRWAGGRTKHPAGYWQVRLDPSDPFFVMTNRTGVVMEHRLVMAKKMGRPLTSRETVHHIDGNRMNNAEENLQLRTSQHGNGIVYQCRDCGSHNVVPVKLH